MNARVDNVLVSHGRQFFAQVGRMLVFDVFDDWVPASVVVDQVAVAWRIDNVQSEPDVVLLHDVRHGLDLCRLSQRFVGFETAFRVDEVGRKERVDQCRLTQTTLTCIYTLECLVTRL